MFRNKKSRKNVHSIIKNCTNSTDKEVKGGIYIIANQITKLTCSLALITIGYRKTVRLIFFFGYCVHMPKSCLSDNMEKNYVVTYLFKISYNNATDNQTQRKNDWYLLIQQESYRSRIFIC